MEVRTERIPEHWSANGKGEAAALGVNLGEGYVQMWEKGWLVAFSGSKHQCGRGASMQCALRGCEV